MITHERLTEKCGIELYPHQEEHVTKIWKHLVDDLAFSVLNTSNTGSGKTLVTLYIAWHLQQIYGTQVMIVAPSDSSLNNKDGWLAHAEEIGLEVMEGTTYTKLRGSRGKVSHSWLIPDPEDKKKWTATRKFSRKCEKGLFLIFDEFHHTKNLSSAHFACAALVKAAKKHRSVCRVALLSHTPGDKPEVIPQILRMAGIITEIRLFRHVPFTTNEYEWRGYGLGELASVCQKIDKQKLAYEKVEQSMTTFSAKKANQLCLDLYQEYIRDIITFAMPKAENKHTVTMLNYFFQTDPESLKILNDGIDLLTGAVGWDPVTEQVAAQAEWDLGSIGRGLKMIEQGKLNSIARYVMEESAKNPMKKFVICCGGRNIDAHQYLASIISKPSISDSQRDILASLKTMYRIPRDIVNMIAGFIDSAPIDCINGQIPKKQRTQIVADFQSNSDASWCVVVSPGTGSESLSFHDKHGNRPRDMLIVPDFFHSRVCQAAGRVNRVGMRSDAKIMIVYSREASLETKILDSMARKAKLAKTLMAKDQDVVFPGEYPFYIEGDRDIDLENHLNMFRNNF